MAASLSEFLVHAVAGQILGVVGGIEQFDLRCAGARRGHGKMPYDLGAHMLCDLRLVQRPAEAFPG
jgi:hypothetical protein